MTRPTPRPTPNPTPSPAARPTPSPAKRPAKRSRSGNRFERFSTRAVLERIGGVPIACVLGAVLIAAGAGVIWNTSPYYGRNDQRVAEQAAVGQIPLSGGKYSLSVDPNRIVIPALQAKAPIVEVATGPNRELEVPQNPKIVGWWKPGARPGAAVGTSVFAGHINYSGVSGTFADIGKLKPGDKVDVYGKYNASAKMVEFEVTAVRTYHKTALPYAEIFDQKSVGRMALVTCGGPFDASTGNYLDNIVVYAIPIGSRAA